MFDLNNVQAYPKSGRQSSRRRPQPAKEHHHLVRMREALKGVVNVHATKVDTAMGALLASINHNLKQLAGGVNTTPVLPVL